MRWQMVSVCLPAHQTLSAPSDHNVRWRTDVFGFIPHSPVFTTPIHTTQENSLLHYTLVFLVIALIAGLLGFGGLASGAAGIAKVLFGVFVVLAVISAIAGFFKR